MKQTFFVFLYIIIGLTIYTILDYYLSIQGLQLLPPDRYIKVDYYFIFSLLVILYILNFLIERLHIFNIIIVLTIYALVNYYIFIHCLQALHLNGYIRLAYYFIFAFLFISYILSRLLERSHLFSIASIFTWVGSLWLAAIFYFFLFIVLFDMVKLFEQWFHFMPSFIYENYQKINLYLALTTIIITITLIVIGYINSIHPRTKKLECTIAKKINNFKKLNIIALSDVHMGIINGHKRIEALVRQINKVQPDIVLFAGDIIDEVLTPVLYYNMGKPLKNINAPLGVYAITGNHEYIGGIENSARYLQTLNINLLRDTTIKVADSFYIIGREDRIFERLTDRKRKGLKELVKNIDNSYPVILLDHQPVNFDEAVKNNIDLQISGHTHHGQLWPFNYITEHIYEMSYGHKQKGNSHIYVSCGYGTWGPPMRIGNRPEIVNIILTFE